MRLAYGTYATPTIPLEEAIPILADIGYDGIEICMGPKHGSMPDDLTPERRAKIKELLEQHNMGVPAVFVLGHLYAKDDAEFEATKQLLSQAAQFAKDIGGWSPVVAMGIGGKTDEYEDVRDTVVEQLKGYGRLGWEEDFMIAGEAHCNAAFDRSERITWLFDAVSMPRMKFHFDIVHLFLANESIEDAVKTLLPHTRHTHVTDAIKHPDGTFDLVLPGKGDLDMAAYVKAMHDNGWNDYITLEVSTRVWSQPDYDPIEAAKFCYQTLDDAFQAAGVTRG